MALAALPVIGPSPVRPESRIALGDLSARLDRGNLHPYPGGGPPLANLPEEKQLAAEVSAQVITEVGYHSALSSTDPHPPASEEAIAQYTPRLFLEAFMRARRDVPLPARRPMVRCGRRPCASRWRTDLGC